MEGRDRGRDEMTKFTKLTKLEGRIFLGKAACFHFRIDGATAFLTGNHERMKT